MDADAYYVHSSVMLPLPAATRRSFVWNLRVDHPGTWYFSDFTISFRSMCESDIPTACDKAAIFLFNRSASIKFSACDIFYLGG